jgi:hypothetical protein
VFGPVSRDRAARHADQEADALYPSAIEGDPPLPDPEGLGYGASDEDEVHADGGDLSAVQASSSAEESE